MTADSDPRRVHDVLAFTVGAPPDGQVARSVPPAVAVDADGHRDEIVGGTAVSKLVLSDEPAALIDLRPVATAGTLIDIHYTHVTSVDA